MTITDHTARIIGEGAANALHTANAFNRSARNAFSEGDVADAIAYAQSAEAHVTLAETLANQLGDDRAGQYRASANEIRGRLCEFIAYAFTSERLTTASDGPAEPADDGTTGRFRVGGLTGLNSQALREVGADRLGFTKLGSTFVVFTGTPDSVAAELQTVMDEIRAKRGGRDSAYRSLIAVRNKVLAGYGSKHVKVER